MIYIYGFGVRLSRTLSMKLMNFNHFPHQHSSLKYFLKKNMLQSENMFKIIGTLFTAVRMRELRKK